ncbi:MAG: ASKHA domain-containing protein, partial [Lachnospiraceae bacterium]|nr:ASKHA domain-containing protein [Lachnospiraceae bacterium]
MADIRIITGKNIIPEFSTVLKLLGCRGREQSQDEIKEQFDMLLPKLRIYLNPKAALALTPASEELKRISGQDKIMYVALTLGKGTDTLCKSCFQRGDAFSGLLVSLMADASLFAFESQVQEHVKRMCREEGFGISKRLFIPEDLPVEMMKTACDAVEAKRTLGISLTSAYMMNPEKSMCYVLAVTEDASVFQAGHNCSRCGNQECLIRPRTVTLTLLDKQGKREIPCAPGTLVADILNEHGISFLKPCGGLGKCGKCRVKLTGGELQVTRADENCLTTEELQAGIRLGCQAKIWDNVTVSMEEDESEKAQILGSFTGKEFHIEGENCRESEDISYGAAVDIGTTTLAFSLMGLESKKVLHSYACMNPQREFGLDVMSRIQGANQGNGKALRELIQKELQRGIQVLLTERKIPSQKLKKIVFSGNTTMFHLLRGYSCKNLGAAPFTPVSLSEEMLSSREALGEETIKARVFLPPGASAFIGADIISGLFACRWQEKKEISLFLDLGTNGEMALGNCDSFFTASTAVGPAFEGGNITFGTGSVKGAVSHARYTKGKLEIDTIMEGAPAGICGTGLIEITAELLKAGIIDFSGRLSEEYFETGFPVAEKENGEIIRLFQKDIRELQLAKGAVRAGIEVLLKKMGIGYGDVKQVYLSGGFGFYLPREKAAYI